MDLCAAGGRLVVHVPVGGAADIKKREPRASKRPTASPGSLVSGTVLHVLADHATVQLGNGEQLDIYAVLPVALHRWYVFLVHSHVW